MPLPTPSPFVRNGVEIDATCACPIFVGGATTHRRLDKGAQYETALDGRDAVGMWIGSYRRMLDVRPARLRLQRGGQHAKRSVRNHRECASGAVERGSCRGWHRG